MAISFSGVGSGLDTESIIRQLSDLERLPAKVLESKKTSNNKQISLLGDLAGKLRTLGTAASALDSSDEIASLRPVASDTKVAGLRVTGTPHAGVHSLTVTSLASAETSRSRSFPDNLGGVAGAGEVTIEAAGGDPVTIYFDYSHSLSDIAEMINEADAGVRAGVINDGTGFRLVVRGQETGAANGITFSNDTSLAMTEVAPATDAQLRFDNIDVTRASNTISDLIPGVTLELAAAGTTTVTVDRDQTALKDKVKALVDGMNAITGMLNNQLGDDKAKRADTLAGDTAVRGLQRRLGAILTGDHNFNGRTIGLGTFGVRVGKDGNLSFDEAKLNKAIGDNPGALEALFTTAETGIAAQINAVVEEYTSSTDGLLIEKQKGIKDRIADYDRQILQIEDRASMLSTRLRNQFTALDSMMAQMTTQATFISALFYSRS